MSKAFPISEETIPTTPIIAMIAALVEAGLTDVEEAADALLESDYALGRKHGVFTAVRLARRMRLEAERLPALHENAIPEEVQTYLVEQRTDELVQLARLGPMQEICFRLCASGLSVRQTASVLGIGRRRVELHLRSARRRVKAVYHEGPYAGWYEVYLSEVRRGRGSR